jgi:DNA-binding response OmpR family regulator
MLLERPGEVVLREEIRTRLWPNGTVVEVGHRINAAVQRLREALGDSAWRSNTVESCVSQSRGSEIMSVHPKTCIANSAYEWFQ